jgi:glycosyltransferase involved in cell wall biosynthesis
MVNVLIINDWISNIVAGGTYRIQGFAKGFQSLGHKVMIVTPWGVVEYGKYSVIHQLHVKSPLYYATTSLGLAVQLVRAIMKVGLADIVFIQMPSPFTKALTILPILKIFDVPIILDFGDPWWKESDPEVYKYISSKIIQVQAKESILISSSSKLILKLIDHKNKVHIPNGVDIELFRPENEEKYDESSVGFLGAFTKRNGAEIIIPILTELMKRGIDVKFMLVGGGELLPTIYSEVIRRGLEKRVIVLGDVPRRKIPKLLSMCNVLVAPYLESTELHYIFPTKVPEMMALKKPVITAPLYEIVTTFKVYEELLVAKYNAMDYADKIELLLRNSVLRDKIAERGYERIHRDFTWEKLSMKILKNVVR